jgi:hypothetical protein
VTPPHPETGMGRCPTRLNVRLGSMSELGQKRKLAPLDGMSGLPPEKQTSDGRIGMSVWQPRTDNRLAWRLPPRGQV